MTTEPETPVAETISQPVIVHAKGTMYIKAFAPVTVASILNGASLLVAAFTCAVVAIRVELSVAACVVVVGLPASATSFDMDVALPTDVIGPVKLALVVTVEALPVSAPTNVVHASELVAELYVSEALVFGPRSPVAAVKKATKQVVSDASFATVIAVGTPPPAIVTRATPEP
jgi:hypothetical protein